MSDKQIFIIEDLGIPKDVFKTIVRDADLEYELVWDERAADKNKVEVVVLVKHKMTRKELDKFPNLKMIAVAFTGYDAVDGEACKEKDIAVYNVPSYSTHSVSELTLGLAIGLLREIPKGDRYVKEGKWDLKPGNELYGKTVGIMGTGTIGLNTARIFKAMGCKLIGWSRTQREEFKALDGKYVEDKLRFFQESDLITVNVPLNAHTKDLVAEEELAAMKSTAFLINTARGPIVNAQALANALKNKRIAGAAIDVYDQEPVQPENPLLKVSGTILTPHIAYKTEEALQRRAEISVENICNFRSENSQNRVY